MEDIIRGGFCEDYFKASVRGFGTYTTNSLDILFKERPPPNGEPMDVFLCSVIFKESRDPRAYEVAHSGVMFEDKENGVFVTAADETIPIAYFTLNPEVNIA